MEVRTVFMPRGLHGKMFVLLSDGSYHKSQPGSNNNAFVKSSESEFLRYKDESINLWWIPLERRWGTGMEYSKSLREMKKNE